MDSVQLVELLTIQIPMLFLLLIEKSKSCFQDFASPSDQIFIDFLNPFVFSTVL